MDQMKDLGYPDSNSTSNLGTLWFLTLFICLRMVILMIYKIFRLLFGAED
jgi:hypothetical protein